MKRTTRKRTVTIIIIIRVVVIFVIVVIFIVFVVIIATDAIHARSIITKEVRLVSGF